MTKKIQANRSARQADVDRDIASIVSNMGKVVYQEAYDKGRAITLDEAVAYALDGE